MRQGLQLRLSQHLALTPQLQQSIRLLQLSTLELNNEIDQALQDNPLLERDEPEYSTREMSLQPGEMAATPPSESSANESAAADVDSRNEANSQNDSRQEDEGWGAEISSSHNSRDPNDDDQDRNETQAGSISLREHLGSQLALTQLNDRDRALVSFLIEALDDDGYLNQELDELLELLLGDDETGDPGEEPRGAPPDDLRENLREELGIALRHLQHLEPAGVGARNAVECLSLQLRDLDPDPVCQLAQNIVSHHLDLLAARDFPKLNKLLGCDDDALREAQQLIRSLNPRPAAAFSSIETRYVTPDVTVKKLAGQWVATLNNAAMPRLRINRLYANILQSQRGTGSGSAGAAGGLANQLQEAKWLIKNIQQRFDTILRVSQAIVDRQRAFFDHGEVAMRPLTLREIAETVELHESTISRVTTQKYLSSPRGVFELKYFFGSHVATDSGGAASSTAIRALIKQLVGAEDGKKPLSDSRLAEILSEQGIVVARRTVAKYRDVLSIPTATLRRTL